MKKFRGIFEQHREVGRFKPVKPHVVKPIGPRPQVDSAKVKVNEENVLNRKTLSVEELAKKHNMSVSEIENLIVQGSKVEMEHTKEKDVAREIAMDHIAEKPDYYKKLKKYVESTEMNEDKKTSFMKTIKRIVTRTDAGSRAHQELDKAHKVDAADSGKYIRRFKKFQAVRGVPVNEGSVQDTIHSQHQALRKKSGLPHPDYYKELGKSYDIEDHEERAKKQAEIRAKYGQQRESVEDLEEAQDYKVEVTHKDSEGKEQKMIHNLKNVKHRSAAGYIALQKHGDAMKKKGIEYKSASARIIEDVEQLDEMPGANMDTRAVHQHLKKQGWKITRTSGGHDVFTHPDAEHHIAVPRHRQLKAPLVKGILKQAKVNEETEVEKNSAAARTYKEKPEKQPMEKMKEAKEMKGGDPCWKGYEMVGQKMKNGKKVPNCVPVKEEANDKQKPYVSSDGKGTYEVLGNRGQTKATFSKKEHGPDAHKKAQIHLKNNYDKYMNEDIDFSFESEIKTKQKVVAEKYGMGHSTAHHLARQALRKQVENMKPMKESILESRKAEIVKDIVKKKKKAKQSDDEFQSDPILTSQIVKEDK